MDDVEAIAALQDPVRKRLYDYVVSQAHDVGRAEAADATGVTRTLAAFHLDRLADAGLLDVCSRRPEGRTGPGAGRPAKLYRRSEAEHAVSLPPRDYGMAAGLLAEVVDALGAEGDLERVARRDGRAIGSSASGGAEAVLRRQGYEPYESEGVLRLRNCPFHALARDFPPVVCGMNLALLEGVLDGLGETGLTARMDPRPGECCVALVSKNNEH